MGPTVGEVYISRPANPEGVAALYIIERTVVPSNPTCVPFNRVSSIAFHNSPRRLSYRFRTDFDFSELSCILIGKEFRLTIAGAIYCAVYRTEYYSPIRTELSRYGQPDPATTLPHTRKGNTFEQ